MPKRIGKTFILALSALALTAVIVIAAFALIGPERVWALFGPADLGPVSFSALERRETPNDALACPPDICRAQSDLAPPVYAVSAEELRAALGWVIASEPRVTRVATEDAPMVERYVERSALLGFPD